MSPDTLVRRDVATSLGTAPIWHVPGAFAARRPVVLVVADAFASRGYLSRLPGVLERHADTAFMHLPGDHAPRLGGNSVQDFAQALDEVLDATFPDRPVILLGAGVGALVALAATSGRVRHVVAIEPLLSMRNLWPLLPGLQERLRLRPDDGDLEAMLASVFGVGRDAVEARTYHHLFRNLHAPVDVLLGSEPLHPQRTVERCPSLVDENDRAFLTRQPGVDFHVVPDSGHALALQRGGFVIEILTRACARVVRQQDEDGVRGALLGRVPLDTGSVCYLGDEPEAVRQAWRRRSASPFWTAESKRPATTLLADDVGRIVADPGLLDLIAPGGLLVTILRQGRGVAPAEAVAALGRAGIAIERAQALTPEGDTFNDLAHDLSAALRAGGPTAAALGGDLVIVGRRAGASAPRPLHVRIATYATRLMDIRTRLPALGLRSDPGLVVTLQKPFGLAPLPIDEPKIQVLQRPPLAPPEMWCGVAAQHIRKGWLMVLEFDDHPELVARAKAREIGPHLWTMFSYVHAVQTSTPGLAEVFGAYNPDVQVFPNAVFDLPAFQERRARRIFYGGLLRGPFAVEVAKSLAPVAEAFPDAEFVVVGDPDVFAALPTARKEFHDVLPYDDYLDLMGTCSISLSPVDPSPLWATKSDAKFIDAAAGSLVTIGSPIVYADTVRHGETGFLADGLSDWAPLLAALLADEPRRARVARAAWEYVRDHRLFAHQLGGRRDWYRGLWARREDLDVALLARHPDVASRLGRR
ncbi:hypothetical protein [Phenylobacterium sp.]|uniref:hypothetical protein n=1 Tax=Phenylobacterium sp. TaxID=1871053 RepID=UPI0025E6A32C|nr:hypothetical protein [Phenylobacterium sp.]MBX3482848.1 hypothetical protein [Phenylobacterium sp.]MCW5758295.1 hypothetical protein [Phenylobacterium sp.]